MRKSLIEFYRDSSTKDHLQGSCKCCIKQRSQIWQKNHPKHYSKWYLKHPQEIAANGRKWRQANPQKDAKRKQAWRQGHLAACSEYTMRYKAAKIQALPKWRNTFFIDEAYQLAKLRTQVFGFPWEVDHIVPLQNRNVCGLHVEYNLQVIPRRENQKKGNRSWPNMWSIL